MHEKIVVLTTYIFLGIAFALWPLLIKEHSSTFKISQVKDKNRKAVMAAILFAASIFIIWFTGESARPLLLAIFIVIGLIISTENKHLNYISFLGTFLSLCISQTILWWVKDGGWERFDPKSMLAFMVILGLVVVILTQRHSSSEKKELITFFLGFIYLLIAGVLSFSTAILQDNNQLLTQWHHWSAYIGPAQQLLSGSVIFRDFPAQYGLGPTMLIAGACGHDCWSGMYFIVSFLTLIFSLLVYLIASSLGGKSFSERLIILMLCLAVCFFWNAYPPIIGSPTVSPSVGGLRFVPSLILVGFLYFSKNIETSKLRICIGHFLWLFGVLWSPESAFYVTFVWSTYYLFIFKGEGSFLSKLKKFAFNVTSLIFIGLIFFGFFLLVYTVIYRQTPDSYAYLAYALNPPGEMPINFRGGIWFVVLLIMLSFISLYYYWRNKGDSLSFRRGFLLHLLFYSALSYFLGRSHDNNILNLMPFALLVLLSIKSLSDQKIFINMSSALCATLLGWMILFGWNSWAGITLEGWTGIFKFEKNLLGNSASVSNLETQIKLDQRFSLSDSGRSYKDASQAISYIHSNYSEPITILDFSMSLENSPPREVWSAFHNPANVFFISSENRRIFIKNTAHTLQKTGWLVINSKYPADAWLSDLDSAYDRIERLDFGAYYAVRLKPKLK